MRFCATALGLLLASILTAQKASQPPETMRFFLVLPENFPSEAAQIRYFASGPQEGYGGFLKEEPGKNDYELSVPGTKVQVIAYLPGCQFDTLVLTTETPTTQELDCRPLRLLTLSGRIVPEDALAGRTATVEASYVASWAHEFFGIADGMVPTFRVATAAPKEDGTFEISLPDFAEDGVATRWELKGEWQFLLREVGTGNILANLKPTERDGIGLPVRSSYPKGVTFTVVPN